MKLKKIEKVLFCFLLLFSCDSSIEKCSLSDADNYVLYVQAKSKNGGIYSDNFGDIVLLNLSNKKKCYITDDNFFDSYPTISHDGKNIVFVSSREGNHLKLKLLGLSAPVQIYSIELANMRLKKISSILEERFDTITRGIINNLTYTNSDNELIFETYKKQLIRFNLKNDSIMVINAHPESFDVSKDDIDNFNFSFKNNLITISYHFYDFNFEGKDSTVIIMIDSLGFVHRKLLLKGIYYLGGWSKEGNKLLFSNIGGQIKEYDYYSNEFYNINIPKIHFKFPVLTCYYSSDNKIISFAEHNENSNLEIVQFDTLTKKFEWLTNDGYAKEFINVFVKD